MSDFADLAAAREQELRDDALARHRRARADEGADEGASAATCVLCDAAIPAARQAALPGVQTCLDCARELEQALHRAGRRGHGRRPR